ncbi:oligosaccharide flippase family protein [Enteroscipio rubneri]|uniref:Uncharacterized protein n=1 Tax=Enteroscipio rubneri TaxID=2070686 RepID=A0A2K2UA89_9ACTN|nr:oligosaccharide flippase family protein [Enteroscipio rubneri]PNV67189.1 hypothetical protein C2L71_08875 [Enteroscipio rubneri]
MLLAIEDIKHVFASLKAKGAFAILSGAFLTKVAAFLGSLILVRIMSKSEYGVLGYMENLYTYACLFAGYGLNNAVYRYLVLKETEAEKKGIFDYVVSQGTKFNIVYVAVLSLLAFLFPHSEEFSTAHLLLPLMLLALPLQFLSDTCSFSLRGLFRNRAFAFTAVLTVVLVWGAKAAGATLSGLEGVAASWPIAYCVVAFVLLLYFRNNIFSSVPAIAPEKEERRGIRSYSLQYMVTNSLWALFLQNDLLMISLLTGDASAVADYKVAFAIPSVIAILSSSVGIFVAPYFIKQENDKAWVWSNYKKTFIGTAVLVGGAAILVCLVAEPVVGFFYGEQYLNIVPLMNLLLVTAFVTNGLRYTTANLLAAMGKIRVNMFVSFSGMVCQIVLNFILIPLFGVYGAAYTSIMVYSFMAIAVFVPFVMMYRAH